MMMMSFEQDNEKSERLVFESEWVTLVGMLSDESGILTLWILEIFEKLFEVSLQSRFTALSD